MPWHRSYSNLPEEIIFDILSRLSAKSVVVCRCVSKPWRTLLSQPDFIKTHLHLTKTNSVESLVIAGDRGKVIYTAPLNNGVDKITLSLTKLSISTFAGCSAESKYCIYDSCDGMLLVKDNQRNKFIINPVTREIRQVSCLSLAIHPRSTFFLHGFGYDSVNDDYKLITISFSGTWKKNVFRTNKTFVHVYSLKIGSWKSRECCRYNYLDCSTAFIEGCLHFFSCTTDNKVAIVAFNLVDEKFRYIPLLVDDIIGDFKLCVLGGCLCMHEVDANGEVWVMKEYGVQKSWTKFMLNNFHGRFRCFLSGQEQVVMQALSPRRCTIWNPKQETMKEIVFNELDGSNLDKVYIKISFVESIVSPHGSNKRRGKNGGDKGSSHKYYIRRKAG